MDRQTALQVLGLPPSADAAATKAAFRKKAMQYHPDRNSSPTAKAQFQLVNEAYTFLTKGGGASEQTSTGGSTYGYGRSSNRSDHDRPSTGLDWVPLNHGDLHMLDDICRMMGIVPNVYTRLVVLQHVAVYTRQILVEFVARGHYLVLGRPGFTGGKVFSLGEYLLRFTQNTTTEGYPHTIKGMAEHIEHMRPAVHTFCFDTSSARGAHTIRGGIYIMHLILDAELNKGKDAFFRTGVVYQTMQKPYAIHLWMGLHPGKTEKDAKKALHYKWRRTTGRLKNIFS